MNIKIFLTIYLTLCFFIGAASVRSLGTAFLPVFLLAVVVGGIGATYTLKHHMPETDDES